MTIWEGVQATAVICAFSAFLVFVDPLTIFADWLEDWLDDRRRNRP